MVKFFLIFILFTPDGGNYQDVVLGFDTEAQCLAAQEETKAIAKKAAPGAYFSSQCVRPGPVIAVRT
jgi:hypothetical protein